MKKVVLILALLCLSYYTWNSDSFQKTFFPKEYWQRRVIALEKVVEHALLSLQNAQLEMERKKTSVKFDFQEYVNEYVMGGMSYDQAREHAYKDIEANLNNSQKALEISYKYLNRCQMHLDKAREELAKCK